MEMSMTAAWTGVTAMLLRVYFFCFALLPLFNILFLFGFNILFFVFFLHCLSFYFPLVSKGNTFSIAICCSVSSVDIFFL